MCYRQLMVSLSLWGSGFDLWSVHVGFMVDKVALGRVSIRVLWLSRAIII